jgi:hypothetical protein
MFTTLYNLFLSYTQASDTSDGDRGLAPNDPIVIEDSVEFGSKRKREASSSSDNDSPVLKKPKDHHLGARDKAILNSNRYINDNIIDSFFYRILKNKSNTFYFSCCQTYMNLNPRYINGVINKYFDENVTQDQTLDAFKNRFQDMIKSIISSDELFWPQQYDNHWYLFHIKKTLDSRRRTIYEISCYDGLNCNNDTQLRAFENIKQCLQNIHRYHDNRPVFRDLNRVTVANQGNGVDCGAAICFYGYLLANNLDLTKETVPLNNISHEPYTIMRQEILRLLGENGDFSEEFKQASRANTNLKLAAPKI